MPRFLNTRGRGSTLGIGCCDRCQRKFPLDELRPDANSPGLMVCREDWDALDPYRRGLKQPESVNLPFHRPEQSIAVAGGVDPIIAVDPS